MSYSAMFTVGTRGLMPVSTAVPAQIKKLHVALIVLRLGARAAMMYPTHL